MLNAPALVAAANPLGMVVTSSNAHLGEVDAAVGTNIYAGDALQTEPTGTLRVKVSGSQIYLAPSSFAVLLGENHGIAAKLVKGTLSFSSSPSGQFQIETPVGTVRAANGKSALGEVTIVAPEKILVSAYHGALVVAGGGVERTIKEGDAFNVTLVLDPQGPDGAGTGNQGQGGNSGGNQNGSGNGGNGNSHYGVRNHAHLIFDAFFIGAFSGAGFAAWHLATESDSQPHN
jgi:hypothetical protein